MGAALAYTRLGLFGLGRHNPALGIPPVEEPCTCEMQMELLGSIASKLNLINITKGGFVLIQEQQREILDKLKLLIAAVERTKKGRL
jgi:hypothetical protein